VDFFLFNQIFSYSGEEYEEHPFTRYYHSRISLGKVVDGDKQYAVAIGSHFSTGYLVEYYDIKFKSWSYGTSFPSCRKIDSHFTASGFFGKVSQQTGKVSQRTRKVSQQTGKVSQQTRKVSQQTGKVSQQNELKITKGTLHNI